jgi:V/A-type H+-transporting ATPase subunit K
MRTFYRRAIVTAGACALTLAAVATRAAESAAGVLAADTSGVSQRVGLGAAAAFAIGASVCGAGYAVGRIGSAAIGAAAEKPELLTRSLLFVALAEGLAVLGFVIAIMLFQKM